MERRPENVAAAVNGIIVMLAPALLMILPALFRSNINDSSSYVTAPDPAGLAGRIAEFPWMMFAAVAPFAAVAAWRTRVHAVRWRTAGGTGWQGVAEGGALGLLVALGVLSPGIIHTPEQAAPYVIVYGSAALILGLLAGVLLRFTALVALRLLTAHAVPLDPL